MTYADAKTAVVAALISAVADTGVAVLAYDPPSITGETLTVSSAGLSPTEYRLHIRIHVGAIDSQAGQDRLDVLTEAADLAALPCPRSDWEFVYDEVKGTFYMQAVAEFPREDF